MFRDRRLPIDHQPIQPQLLDHDVKFVKIHRLAQIAVDAQLIAADKVLLLGGGGEHDHRDGSRVGVAFDDAQNFQAIELGQLEIEQNEPRMTVLAAGKTAAAKQEV